MAKKKELKTIHKFIIICGVLIAANVAFLFSSGGGDQPLTTRQSLDLAVEQLGDKDPQTKLIRRITLAINHYRLENENEAPSSLDQLVPAYFDMVPNDPVSGEPFVYEIRQGYPVVFAPGQDKASSAASAASKEVGISEAEQEALIAGLEESDIQEVAFIYDPTGKRDPFVPFDFSPTAQKKGDGIFCCQLGQFRLSVVLLAGKEPRAIVETEDGKGFTVTQGSKIGVNRGEVVEILPDTVRILETSTDFTGKEQTKTIELQLRNNQ